MKIKLAIIIMLFPILGFTQGKEYSVKSPDGNIVFTLRVNDLTYISATYKGKAVLDASEISMNLSDQVLGDKEIIEKTEEKKKKPETKKRK